MDAFLTSLGLVALAEMGDKTQLLALVLATRFRRPWAVIAGIFAATVVNHTLTGLVGIEVGGLIPPLWLKWGLGLSYVVMGAWTLVPDQLGDDEGEPKAGRHGAFVTTMITFFLVEMGDKTQIATMALAAQFQNLAAGRFGHHLGHACGRRAGGVSGRASDPADPGGKDAHHGRFAVRRAGNGDSTGMVGQDRLNLRQQFYRRNHGRLSIYLCDEEPYQGLSRR